MTNDEIKADFTTIDAVLTSHSRTKYTNARDALERLRGEVAILVAEREPREHVFGRGMRMGIDRDDIARAKDN